MRFRWPSARRRLKLKQAFDQIVQPTAQLARAHQVFSGSISASRTAASPERNGNTAEPLKQRPNRMFGRAPRPRKMCAPGRSARRRHKPPRRLRSIAFESELQPAASSSKALRHRPRSTLLQQGQVPRRAPNSLPSPTVKPDTPQILLELAEARRFEVHSDTALSARELRVGPSCSASMGQAAFAAAAPT